MRDAADQMVDILARGEELSQACTMTEAASGYLIPRNGRGARRSLLALKILRAIAATAFQFPLAGGPLTPAGRFQALSVSFALRLACIKLRLRGLNGLFWISAPAVWQSSFQKIHRRLWWQYGRAVLRNT